MNPVTWSALSHELLVGPLSELVDVGDFLRGACNNSASVFTPEPLALLQQARCRPSPLYLNADDVRSKLIEIFNDPRLYVHARRVHDTSVNAIYEQAERNTSKKRKRKPEVVSELEDPVRTMLEEHGHAERPRRKHRHGYFPPQSMSSGGNAHRIVVEP
ncbi:hypothetical protein EDB84DRAFT_1676809 [Lactarius hengduanensis]|nr:hypothetical protein EDB84DRAFT_1676809 [Lactarius hengduanensis]